MPPPGRPAPFDVGRGLIVACHPLPCLAVTAFAAAWALALGLSPARTALLALAVLLGQLSIGWCNDWVDAPRDRAVGRRDKPVVQGVVPVRLLGVCAVVALGGCVAASLGLGVRPGLVHLVGVGSGWAYDLLLKPTVASPLPYAVAFGSLPAVATLAADQPHWPAAGVVAGGALLGTAAHFANTVGDVDDDAATGVRGLPQRLGPVASLRVSAVLVALAACSLLTAATRAGAVPLALLAAGAVLAACGAGLAGRMAGRGRAAFRLTLAAVALVVGGFLLTA
jgi:4-hydroxybenzoate polyprenyltransferase